MAESNNAAAPAINTNIESGNFDEKAGHHNAPEHVPATKPKAEEAAPAPVEAPKEEAKAEVSHSSGLVTCVVNRV